MTSRLTRASVAVCATARGYRRPSEPRRTRIPGRCQLSADLPHARVVPAENPREVRYRWAFEGRNLDAPLWPISRSAADLLTSDSDLHKVRQCGGSDCNWLFLDTSKNRTRQWCSMQSCGNREKARRHYQRQRRALLNKA